MKNAIRFQFGKGENFFDSVEHGTQTGPKKLF
jgi:hypothetical protein